MDGIPLHRKELTRKIVVVNVVKQKKKKKEKRKKTCVKLKI